MENSVSPLYSFLQSKNIIPVYRKFLFIVSVTPGGKDSPSGVFIGTNWRKRRCGYRKWDLTITTI